MGGSSKKKIARFLGLVLLLSMLSTISGGRQAGASQPQPDPVDSALQSEVEAYLQDLAGVYGVAIQDLNSGQTVQVNADEPFLAASTYKVLVMYRVYQQMEDGWLAPDEYVTVGYGGVDQDEPYAWLVPGDSLTVADALEDMITASSNAAAYALAWRVGGWGSVESAAAEIGMCNTWLEDGYFWTTPSDMLTFFRKLADGQLVSAEASKSMTELLERQRLNDRIPALLPDGVSVAHKTGSLYGAISDAGIVYAPAGSYIMVVYTSDAYEGEAISAIAEVSLMAYERYANEQEERCSPALLVRLFNFEAGDCYYVDLGSRRKFL